MKYVTRFWFVFFDEWGFRGAKDYFMTVLGLKAIPFFNLQLVGTIVAAGFAFCADWVWNPPQAAILIIAMTLVNSRYGYLVAKRIKGESWSWKKFHRTFSIIVSDVLIMSMLHAAIKYYPYYSFLADLLFGWLLTHKGRAILQHMALLKLQEGGISKFLQKFIQTKLGNLLVDSIQKTDEKTNNEPS